MIATTAPSSTLPPAPERPSHAGIPAAPLVPGLPEPGERGTLRLPPPPPRGGEVERREFDQLRAIAGSRSPEGDQWARRMDTDGQIEIWRDLAADYRKSAGTLEGIAGTALLGTTMAATLAASQAAKLLHRRPRPYQADPTFPNLFPARSHSYPSGHASNSFAAARILGALDPKLAQPAYEAARQVADSRVYAGVHFPSDVVAGARLGAGVADLMLRLVPGV